ncbi:transcriptional regulator [Novosphingobium indicum]|uniref:Transcriptional regulator n=1 Tax=Novosphingobium indicum TaxID=462949 RepID=A0ABQ2K1U3_9SPHN|nr:HigA family addiction module antitoxin [Novosphingobium indicum]GGN62506.1 transcriptional regulator [Novosphingobium indicum]
MAYATPPPVDHPGTFIKEELEDRGWTQADLSYILHMDVSQLNKLIKGATSITPDTAVALGDAFDMPAEFFLNLQQLYDLHRTRKADPGVKARAAWVSKFPVREMIKRRWIEDAEPDLLDLQMLRFFGKNRIEDIPFVSDAPLLAHAARKQDYAGTTELQYVWLNRVRKMAEQIECPLYSEEALRKNLPSIREHMHLKDDLIHIPEILHKSGVRFVLVEALPGSKIDGVCVWLGGQPVIGMTLRLDRIDNFCFVLMHEITHVLNGDGKEFSFAPVDSDTGNDVAMDCEKVANDEAAEFCVPRALMDSFIARKSPFISRDDVLSFAARLEIHPGVVVGQIQNRTKKWNWLREYQIGIREYLLEWKHKDGWGHFSPTGL